ncbi:uncharacterized protein PV06_06957 [Exophiala oligosperma]|uniref:FAD/NAD(P)-binding domain-containing protein n=1 Tax=Exophiala oligosperma TaxID=215243 RepID=A0A0D2DG53_9EURO|nr:uncharacterized protein PV06_06957 [Exophiala oligosperma]KIW41395.1 hypothetical protein PV06_06957 [Exophiala oligosperma]
MATAQPSVAVIGCGAQGLVTVKNLLEQGFDVTGFERNDYIGGIWHYSTLHHVSALSSTVVNISRERGCFTDFAFPPGTNSHPTAAEVDQYLNSYADAFDLRQHLRLSTNVQSVERDEANNCWRLTVRFPNTQKPEVLTFDKLIIANGPHNKPVMPELPGRELFKGEIIHSIAYKQPELFKGKRVMVVGASNSAADTSTTLIGIASKIYFSHRRGALILPRYLKDGTSLDHSLSYRKMEIKDALDRLAPSLSIKFMDNVSANIQRKQFGAFQPEWRLDPPPSVLHQNPTVSDTLIPALAAGKIESVHAPKRVLDDHRVELDDRTVVNVDTIIFCTGYSLDYSFLGKYDPTRSLDVESARAVSSVNLTETPRLYQNIFSLEYPSSLAFVGVAVIIFPAFLLSDLSTMAIAQLWSNKPDTPTLPSQTKMENWYSEHLSYVSTLRSLSPYGKFVKLSVRNGPWHSWVQDTAGCELSSYLDFFSPRAWKLYWSDPKFSKMLCHGVWSPHVYRLFEPKRPNGRQKWDGAREAIERVNADVQAGVAERRRKIAAAQ